MSAFGILLAVAVSVGYDSGNRPRFFIDGRPYEPLIDCCGHPSGGQNDYTNVCAYIRRSTAAFGRRILNLGICDREYLRPDGTYDWSVLDSRANLFLEADPEAKFLIGIRFIYEDWAKRHPEEQVGYACRPLTIGSGDEYAGAPVRPSSASQPFRAAVFRDLAALAEHVRAAPWGERVVAVRPCYGCSTEWLSYGTLAFPDCGQAMTDYFRSWLRQRYGSDAALRAAWHDESVSFDTVTVPSRREQAPLAFFLDAAGGRRAIDFNRATADSMADLLLAVAGEIKRLLPGRLVGAYYGYVFEALPGSSAVGLYERVLSSGAVDFFSNPPAYCHDIRKPGGDYGQKIVPAALRRYGKIPVVEDDSRLHYMSNWATKGWCMADARADRAILRRNVLNTFFDGGGYQICDPIQGRGERLHSFDDPGALDALREAFGVLRGIGGVPSDSGADMALVITPEDKFFTNTQYFQGEADERNPKLDDHWNVYRGIPLWLHRSGAVFDILTLDDLLASGKTYRKLVFQSAYALDASRRRALSRLTRRPGTTTVWFVAPGSITDTGFSDSAMSELVGLSLTGSGMNPKVVATDGDARVVSACGGGWCKDLGNDSRAFFFPSVPRTAAEAGTLMEAVGEHRYVRADAYVRRLGDYLMVHVGQAGRYEVRLPNPAAVQELFSGVEYPAGSCTVESKGPETWLFRAKGQSVSQSAGWEAKRTAAVNRVRPLVYNTDGCDMLYWPTNLPVSVANFIDRRLKYVLGMPITTVSYCPQSAGFGHFTCRKAGEPLTNTVTAAHYGNPSARNAAQDFFNLGTDALEMATDFCRTNGLEVFVSIRFNDQHDGSSKPGDLNALYPPFKVAHPECLMGALDPESPRRKELYKGYEGWSCVNFGEELVRERMKAFVCELVTNYDVDGIEYDFNRHFMLFRSVATGGTATKDEVEKMTQLMRDLKAITEEVGRKKNRPILIAIRMPDSVEYDLAVGADIETWFKEKLVDIWIGGGYFLLGQLPESVALAHRNGVKFYWSLDETRIPSVAKRGKLPILPGRMSLPFYAGRFSAARKAGVDGVYLFNTEGEFLRDVSLLDPRRPQTGEKVYFALERGSGGYTPDHWLKDGMRFSRLAQIDPGSPLAVKPGETVAFEMFLGDDFAGTLRVTVEALTSLGARAPSIAANGRILKVLSVKNGVAVCQPEAGVLQPGRNAFRVTFPADAPVGSTFNDFAVRIRPYEGI